jgi:hypothetical protein
MTAAETPEPRADAIAEIVHELVYLCGNSCLNQSEPHGLCAEDECADCEGPKLAAETIDRIESALRSQLALLQSENEGLRAELKAARHPEQEAR